MFWPDDYLSRVARQIRVTRVRGPLIAELRDHMLCQKAQYLAEGLSEAEAERKTSEDMGDALLVGGELDAAHRPAPQWKGLLLAALLLALGLVLQGLDGTAAGGTRALFTALALAPLCLSALTDYTLWVRWSLPALVLWLLMVLLRLWIWIAWIATPLTVEGMAFLIRPTLLELFVPQALVAGLPTVAALLACRLRGRGWGGLSLCLLPILALMLMCWEYRDAGHDAAPCMLMAALGLGLLALAVARGFFRVGRGAAYSLLGALFALALAFALPRFELPPADGELRTLLGHILRGARLIGPANAADASIAWARLEEMGYGIADHLLPALAARWGWGPLGLLTLGIAGLLGWSFRRFSRLENRMGALLGLAATATLALQTALYIPASFGLIGAYLCLPLLSCGRAMLMVDAALVGVMLGVLRGENLPEAEPAPRLPVTQ